MLFLLVPMGASYLVLTLLERRAPQLRADSLKGRIVLALVFGDTGLARRYDTEGMPGLVPAFPANVYGAVRHRGPGGHELGPVYLLVRAPFQVCLSGWVYRAGATPASRRAEGRGQFEAARDASPEVSVAFPDQFGDVAARQTP